MHLIDSDGGADRVKIDVAGLRNCIMQVHIAMTFGFPVPVTMRASGQRIKPPAEISVGQIGGACLKRRER